MTSRNCLDTALELLLCHEMWPVVIKPGKKAPIGESWGTTRPTEQSLRAMFQQFPEAGVGLLIGPDGGIIDFDCDGPGGEESLAKLMGGEIIRTLGWSSRRGPHFVYRFDTRLAKYGKSVIKLPDLLPGLEIRIGATGKQLQSNCPPTIGDDGNSREWNGCDAIADVSEAAIAFLDAALAKPKHKPTPSPTTPRGNGYAAKALDDECQAVAAAPDGEQNSTLNTAAFNLGQLVAAGAWIAPRWNVA